MLYVYYICCKLEINSFVIIIYKNCTYATYVTFSPTTTIYTCPYFRETLLSQKVALRTCDTTRISFYNLMSIPSTKTPFISVYLFIPNVCPHQQKALQKQCPLQNSPILYETSSVVSTKDYPQPKIYQSICNQKSFIPSNNNSTKIIH